MTRTAQKRRWFRLNKAKRREYNQRYYAKRAEALREGVRMWRLKNPDKVAERNSAFRARNPNYQRDYRQRVRLTRAWRRWVSVLAQGRQTL